MFISYEKFKKISKGKSMYSISRDTGIAQSTLSDWKLGKSTPKIDKLLTLSEYFNVPINYFFENKE